MSRKRNRGSRSYSTQYSEKAFSVSMNQCPKCGLYVSPMMHTKAACELVRALYPMLKPCVEEANDE